MIIGKPIILTSKTNLGQISLNVPVVSSSGLITASASLVQEGYIKNAPENTTLQLSTEAGKTITPSASEQTAILAGKYTTGNIIISGDNNLSAENIKEGISIFGVTGSLPVSNGSVTLTENGSHNVTAYATVVVAVPEYDGDITLGGNST